MFRERVEHTLLIASLLIAAEAINEGVRNGDRFVGIVLASVAVGVVVVWWLARRWNDRVPRDLSKP
ncbi:MAG TPA: hypothetical protein VGO00_15600 [Kofleriaceae bacterium]|jgi:hypothetical protein|nr:hypothetical protein [Kofleriaceae bacterium]